MKFSKMIFVLTIAASAIFICMMGSSYAYYTATATDISVTTGTINNGISVVFADNNYVNVKTGVPLDDEQVMEYAKANTFSIMPNATTLEGYDAYVNISLINVKIDDAFNYALYKQLNNSLKYKDYELRSVFTGYITNIGSFERQYPYRETDFYNFDKFLFSTWRDKPNAKGKDVIPWGIEV